MSSLRLEISGDEILEAKNEVGTPPLTFSSDRIGKSATPGRRRQKTTVFPAKNADRGISRSGGAERSVLDRTGLPRKGGSGSRLTRRLRNCTTLSGSWAWRPKVPWESFRLPVTPSGALKAQFIGPDPGQRAGERRQESDNPLATAVRGRVARLPRKSEDTACGHFPPRQGVRCLSFRRPTTSSS
jgi:hypothetical protein